MSIHPHSSRPGWWYIALREGKKQRRIPYQGTKEQALLFEAELRRLNRQAPISSYPQLNEAAPEFMAWYRLDHLPSGAAKAAATLHLVLQHFGRMQFTSITPATIEDYKRKRLDDGIQPVTINKELSILSVYIKWAVDRGFVAQAVKVRRFPAKMTRAPMPLVPGRGDVLAVINSMDWPVCGLFACLYFGGLRSAEAKGMLAGDVLLHRRVMIVTGKGNKQRVVPVVDALAPVLARRLAEVDNGLLWTRDGGQPFADLRQIIKWACKRAGVTQHIHPHLFRHAFGTHGTEAGIGLRTLQEVMGHSSPVVTERYTTLAAEALKREMEKFG